MINVQVTIDGVIMYCDESICLLNFGNGYSIQKRYIKDLSYKNKIIDGNGALSINYLGSQLYDEKGEFFLCLHKEDTYQIHGPETPNFQSAVITDIDMSCEKELSEYKDAEIQYLTRMFSLLHLFKKGNVGYKELFFEHRFQLLGISHQNQKQTSDNVTRNIADNTVFTLTIEEVNDCNHFLQHYSGQEYDLLRNNIDEFVWGLEQVDVPTGFEQYTTALEMTLLGTNQQGKKEALAKRVAVLLENDPIKQRRLYDKMKDYYRFRSESLHEGDGQNITLVELKELEEIVRSVLNKYLGFCKVALITNPEVTWDEIKTDKINHLKNLVMTAKSAGIFPN